MKTRREFNEKLDKIQDSILAAWLSQHIHELFDALEAKTPTVNSPISITRQQMDDLIGKATPQEVRDRLSEHVNDLWDQYEWYLARNRTLEKLTKELHDENTQLRAAVIDAAKANQDWKIQFAAVQKYSAEAEKEIESLQAQLRTAKSDIKDQLSPALNKARSLADLCLYREEMKNKFRQTDIDLLDLTAELHTALKANDW